MLIRIGSFKKWVYHSLKHFWLKSAPFLLLWVFVSLFMMIGFPYSWNWSLLSQSDHITNSLNNLVTFFGTPFSAFSAQLILLVLTLTFFHIVLAALDVVTKSINTILLFSVLVLIGSIIGFKILPKEIAFLAPPTYFSINKIVNTFDSIIISFTDVILGYLLSYVCRF